MSDPVIRNAEEATRLLRQFLDAIERTKAEAINAYLASPEAERELALHLLQRYGHVASSASSGWVRDAHAILAAMRTARAAEPPEPRHTVASFTVRPPDPRHNPFNCPLLPDCHELHG